MPGTRVNITVDYLADHQDAIPQIARWLFDEWGRHSPESPDGSVEGVEDNLRNRLRRDALPLAMLAHEDEEPLGTVSLKIREIEIRPQYEHWLGTLFVVKPRRGAGIGSLLVRAAVDAASRLEISELYLYTRYRKTEQWYKRLGWIEVERPEYRGHPAIIMKALLDA